MHGTRLEPLPADTHTGSAEPCSTHQAVRRAACSTHHAARSRQHAIRSPACAAAFELEALANQRACAGACAKHCGEWVGHCGPLVPMWSPCGKLRPCGLPAGGTPSKSVASRCIRRGATQLMHAAAAAAAAQHASRFGLVRCGFVPLWAHRRERRRHRVPVAALRRAEAAGRLPAALLLGVRRPRLPQRNRISMQHATCNMQHATYHTTHNA